MTDDLRRIQAATAECLIQAGTASRPDQLRALKRAIDQETEANARWVLLQLLENAQAAKAGRLPLCDDTGIPHAILRVGQAAALPAGLLTAVQRGLAQGLRRMPGRPMAVQGDDRARVEQSQGLFDDPARLEAAPIILRPAPGRGVELTVLMLGGGPEIRARTRRIFHRRSLDGVIAEAGGWIAEEVLSLGCTPIVLAMGVGRSQVEASALMLEAMATGSLDRQSEEEARLTGIVNATGVGPLGLGGRTTALGSFLKIGPARASGVRIVTVRPCCCVEPRRAKVRLI